MSRIDISNLADDNKKIDATAIFEGAKKLGHKEVAKTVSNGKNLNTAQQEIKQKIDNRNLLKQTVVGSKDDSNIQSRLGLDDLLGVKVEKEIQENTNQQKLAKQDKSKGGFNIIF